ncbi:MAG: hypothetical protein GEV11_06610 [Streptosporangiales bacterium]|nr:hypothetical protein [Streptosporangiales bacterium]
MSDEIQEQESAERIRYPELPSEIAGPRFGFKGALLVFGPGVIVASSTIGSGELIFSARGGAVFSYAIMWTFVVAAAAKFAMVYATNRYMVVTGENPMHRWAVQFPGPRGWFPMLIGLISVVSFPSWAGGLSTAIGQLMPQMTGIGAGASAGQWWATGLLLLAGVLAWTGSYDRMEKAQTVIVGLMIVAVAVSMFALTPDWLGALGGLIPQLPAYDTWVATDYPDIASRPIWLEIATYLGAIGGGVYDYVGYSGMLREKKWGLLGYERTSDLRERFLALPKGSRLPLSDDAEDVRTAKKWQRAPFGDTLLSFAAVTVLAIMFAINGAALLHEQRQVPEGEETLLHQAQFLTTLSPALEYLYYVGVFFAFFGTLYALWEIYSYTTYETLGAVFPKIRRGGVALVRRYLYPYVAIAGVALIWTVGELVAIVTPASVLGGVLGCGLFALALLWTEKAMLPEAYRMRPAMRWYVLVAGILLTVLGIVSVYELVAGL